MTAGAKGALEGYLALDSITLYWYDMVSHTAASLPLLAVFRATWVAGAGDTTRPRARPRLLRYIRGMEGDTTAVAPSSHGTRSNFGVRFQYSENCRVSGTPYPYLEKHGERVEHTTWSLKRHFLTLYRGGGDG